jgi:leader peptidase (prepilin peptidase)/N-methyltransferase
VAAASSLPAAVSASTAAGLADTVDAVVTVAVCAAAGLIVGSFLNVVIARVPEGRSVVRPGSRCPRCEAPIAPRDNIPVVSWVVLRGRARCCGGRISLRYPLVELATGAAFALVAAWATTTWTPSLLGEDAAAAAGDSLLPSAWHGTLWPLPAFLYLAAAGVTLTVIDLDTYRLPFWIVVPSWWVAGILLGGAALLFGEPAAVGRMLAGGLALWGLYRLLHAVYPPGMGYGDVRLAGLLGMYLAWLDWRALVAGAFLGFLVGGLGGVAVMIARRTGLKTQIPYGPYMIVGAWVGIFWGQPLVSAYLRTVGF